jgi:hypothetical protein
MHMIRDAANAVTFAIGISSDRGKVRMERGTNGDIKDGHAVFRAEDDMDEKK